jgi:hypothetical protein
MLDVAAGKIKSIFWLYERYIFFIAGLSTFFYFHLAFTHGTIENGVHKAAQEHAKKVAGTLTGSRPARALDKLEPVVDAWIFRTTRLTLWKRRSWILLILPLPTAKTASEPIDWTSTTTLRSLMLILGESDHASNLQFSAVVYQDSQ